MEHETFDVFYSKLNLSKNLFMNRCKDLFLEKYNTPFFDIFINMGDAEQAIWYKYKSCFKSQFDTYITERIELDMWFSSKNIVYAVKAFTSIKNNNYSFNELIHFIETFIDKQLDGFEEDFDLNFPSDSSFTFNEDPVQ